MKPNPEVLHLRMNRFRDVLARSGLKVTHQRVEIFREVAGSEEHPDAVTIFRGVRKRMPSVSLDTVYRTLWLFIDLGLMTTLGPQREKVRFDANRDPHHHFICIRCGKACDFYSASFDRLEIPGAVKKLGAVESTHVEFRGLCSHCSSLKNRKRSRRGS
jgi:Fur family transcriptional regulator, peroxide stress response regulator